MHYSKLCAGSVISLVALDDDEPSVNELLPYAALLCLCDLSLSDARSLAEEERERLLGTIGDVDVCHTCWDSNTALYLSKHAL